MDSAAQPSGGRPKFGRRTYLIDRSFQLRYTLLILGLGGAVSTLFGGMMFLAHQDFREALMIAGGSDLMPRTDPTPLILLVSSVAMAVAFGLFGVLLTHRVAGPIYVLTQYVGALARGRFPRMRALRKGDELQQFFEQFQVAVERLRTQHVEDAAVLRRSLEKLSADDRAAVLAICERWESAADAAPRT